MYLDITSLQSDLSQSNAGIFSGGNEFQALFATAYNVLEFKNNNHYFPIYLYLNDIINILPPQQLLPFQKVAASDWYLEQIGLKNSGQHYMWGVISQAIIGFDWIELALRGGILGFLLAKFHNWYSRRQSDFFPTIFYVYMCIRIYYTFRDTTFSILSFIVWEIIPFYLVYKLVPLFLRKKLN